MKGIRNYAFHCGLAAILFTRASVTSGGTPSLDLRFRAGAGANGALSEIYVQPNGKILVGGHFDRFNNVPRTNVAKLNPNGIVDRSFESDFASRVPDFSFPFITSAMVQRDGKLLLGGHFGLYRLMRNGRFDDAFVADVLPVNAISVLLNGKILVAEQGSASFAPHQPLIRLNRDGSLDEAFHFEADQYQAGHALLLRPDGSILVGGTFQYVNSQTRPHLARVHADGSLDTEFFTEVGPTSGPDVSPYDIKVQSDGKILIAGAFRHVDRAPRGNIARLHTDGSLDVTFNAFPGVSNGFNGAVHSLALQRNGKIIAAGEFTSFNGIPRNYLARLHPDGSLDEAFNAGQGPSGPLSRVLLVGKNGILIAGAFDSFEGVPQGNISRLMNSQ